MNRDLGTYHVRVEFEDGNGFLMDWKTGARYTGGADGCSPLNAARIGPTWESEDDLAGTIQYMFTDGNYSCDCNKRLFLARAHQQDEPDDLDCGDTLTINRLTLIRPDGSEREIEVE